MSEYLPFHWVTILIAALFALVVAGVGGALTEIGPWYRSLQFPSWKPPNWSFGPIWMVILTFAAASAVLAWAGPTSTSQRTGLVVLFVINAVLNVLWNLLFFTLRRPDWALVETVFLWLSVLDLMVFIWPISTTASLLLAPYLIWVAIAGVLNRAIVRLNGPFAGRTETGTI
jgi:translocator protein